MEAGGEEQALELKEEVDEVYQSSLSNWL